MMILEYTQADIAEAALSGDTQRPRWRREQVCFDPLALFKITKGMA